MGPQGSLRLEDFSGIRQELDLWDGAIRSSFLWKGKRVEVLTVCHPERDAIAVRISSQALTEDGLKVRFGFPFTSSTYPWISSPFSRSHYDLADAAARGEKWKVEVTSRKTRILVVRHSADADHYFAAIRFPQGGGIERSGDQFVLTAGAASLEFAVEFTPEALPGQLPEPGETVARAARHWNAFWSDGACLDLSGSTDARSGELERRAVLSQFLTAIQCSGRIPPQETGLSGNSWYGKFHGEMHWWHAAHFPLWGRTALLERSMPWYREIMPRARAYAADQGYRGVRRPKECGPEARVNPSIIGPFLIWQQPHPIYFAELFYRERRDRKTLEQYSEIVDQTAGFMASFAEFDPKEGRYFLGPPVIPAQETYPPQQTWNPTFELSYWAWGLKTAQRWRERLGLPRNSKWDHVIAHLSPLPVQDGVYVGAESQPDLWEKNRKDHPSFLAALGVLPGDLTDRETMRRTLRLTLEQMGLGTDLGMGLSDGRHDCRAPRRARDGDPPSSHGRAAQPVYGQRALFSEPLVGGISARQWWSAGGAGDDGGWLGGRSRQRPWISERREMANQVRRVARVALSHSKKEIDMKHRTVGSLVFTLSVVGLASSGTAFAAGASCESLTGMELADTTITAAQSVQAGAFKTTDPSTQIVPYASLAAFCRVTGVIKPSPDSDIHFEVWMPLDWNHKFLGVGNGGFAGTIQYADMAVSFSRGYAVAGTDTGHTAFGASWALGHPEKVVDFGHRAIHETAVRAKAIIAAFYGAAPLHSYFNACSNGGRQALMEAQRYPEDYDGIIAGAPANFWTHNFAAFVWNLQAISEPGAFIPRGKFKAIETATLAACDASDGVTDGVIGRPDECRFDPSVLLCRGAESDACLTGRQVGALLKIYAGPKNSKGEQIFPGFPPGGESGLTGWAPWIAGSAPGSGLQSLFGTQFFGYMVAEVQKWDYHTFDIERDVKTADEKLSGILNATDPNLRAFKNRGGKLILYHGLSDAGIPAANTVDYYRRVAVSLGQKDTGTFVRLFLAPGMQHCATGPGPCIFGQVGVTPQAEARQDIQKMLEQWVEKGEAPDMLVAASPADASGNVRTRPLCAYPKVAKWTGKGSTETAQNFVCTVSQ